MENDHGIVQPKGEEPHGNNEAHDEKVNPSQAPHSYLPGIDGLRAVAVMAVLFYHAEMAWMPGGFLGVEVFFVISGYLITGLLIAEWRRTGGINLGRFWFRRARRLLPAVFALLIAVLAFAVIFLPGEVATLRFDALAAAFYVSNWYQIFSHKSYFEAIGRPSLLRHLWSLAVEEQFYLVWPVVLVIFLKIISRLKPARASNPAEAAQKKQSQSQYRVALTIFAIVGAAASALLMATLYNPDVDPSRIYYGTDTRAAGFLIGAALAMLLPASLTERAAPLRFGWLLDVIGAVSIAALTAIFVLVSEINPYLYLGGFTVVAVCTVAAIYATVREGSRLFTRLLSLPVIRWIGLRSYSIYLWHWPIFAVTRPELDIQLNGLPLMLLRLGLTAICAELSYRFVEKPIRDGAIGRLWEKLRHAPPLRVKLQWASIGVAGVVLLIVLGTAVAHAQPQAVPEEYAEAGDIVATETLAPTLTPVKPSVTALPVRRTSTPLTATVAKTITMTQTPLTSTGTPSVTVVARVTSTVIAVITPVTTMDVTSTVAVAAQTAISPTAVVSAEVTATMLPSGTAGPAVQETPTAITTTVSAAQTITDATTLTDVLGANYHITAIGDSVMKGAAVEMQQSMGNIEVDAVVGRQASAALADLRQRHDAGTLGNVLILHIGNNGFITQKQMDEIMQVIADIPRVIFINVHVPLRWEGPNNALIADAVSKAPNATLIDWNAITEGHSDWFAGDGVHLQPVVRSLYTQLIVDRIKAPYLAQHQMPGAQQQPR